MDFIVTFSCIHRMFFNNIRPLLSLLSPPLLVLLLCLNSPFSVFDLFLEQNPFMWKETYSTFLSEFGLFHLTRLSSGILTFLQMTWFYSL